MPAIPIPPSGNFVPPFPTGPQSNIPLGPAVNVQTRPDLPPEPPGYTVSGTTNDYIEWTAWVSYTTMGGLAMMPQTGPAGTPCKIVDLHAPCTRMTIQAILRRTNRPPVLPDPVPKSANAVLLNWNWTPTIPVSIPTGGMNFCVFCFYDYALLVPVTKATGFALPSMPFLVNRGPAQVGVNPADYLQIFQ